MTAHEEIIHSLYTGSTVKLEVVDHDNRGLLIKPCIVVSIDGGNKFYMADLISAYNELKNRHVDIE